MCSIPRNIIISRVLIILLYLSIIHKFHGPLGNSFSKIEKVVTLSEKKDGK